MYTKPIYTIVVLPDNSTLEVSYFFSNKKLKEKEKKTYTNLVVQLHDCHCSYKIDKAMLNDTAAIESLVHKTVISAKGHLC